MAEMNALTTAQTARRRMLSGTAYSLAALSIPDWAHASAPRDAGGRCRPEAEPPERGRAGTERIETAHAEAAEAMARVFAAGDAVFGGGHGRQALAAYLSDHIAPQLRGSMRPGVHRRMFGVATQLSYLCAFMCFDDELHGLAQRYHRASLRLAADSGDQAAYALTLRAMSVQARILGHHRHAVQLAETAATTAAQTAPARQAFLYGQVAVAAAADGDRAGALSALNTAGRRLDRAGSQTAADTGPGSRPGSQAQIGAYHSAALAHQEAAVRALLGDRDGAINALTISLRHRPARETRSRAITTARLAELHLAQGHLEEAVATWHSFLDDYPHLQSERATTALKTMRSRLRPFTVNTAAKQLLSRAATLHQ